MIDLKAESAILADYLQTSAAVDYLHPRLQKLAEAFLSKKMSQLKLIQSIYEYVRDEINHSMDMNGKHVTWKASDVEFYREGICYAKSHLLAALMRAVGIPAGFCYQKLILDDESMPYLVYHGLNAVYIQGLNRWVRLDARGNKNGVSAQFSVQEEILAFPVRPDLGERDLPVIFCEPLPVVLQALQKSETVSQLIINLPG